MAVGDVINIPENNKIIDPFSGKRIDYMTVETVFDSGSRPVLLNLQFLDIIEGTKSVIFKRGDDLRRDCIVHTLFAVFNRYVEAAAHANSIAFGSTPDLAMRSHKSRCTP